MPRINHSRAHDGRIVFTKHNYDCLDVPAGERTQRPRTSPPEIVDDFLAPMWLTAARWVPAGNPEAGLGSWQALDPSLRPELLRWVRRELLVAGFSWRLGWRYPGRADDAMDLSSEIVCALLDVLTGNARLSVVNEVTPAIVSTGVMIGTRLAAGALPGLSCFENEDPVGFIHGIIAASAQGIRPHTEHEIGALLDWCDHEAMAYGVELVCAAWDRQNRPKYDSQARRSCPGGMAPKCSVAEDNTEALVSVERGFVGVEWSPGGGVFHQLIDSRGGSLGKPAVRKRRSKPAHRPS